MARQGNKEIFLGGLRKLFEEQWQVDVLLKAGNSDECASISAHKLVLVFSLLLKCLFIVNSIWNLNMY